jgi:Leucine-rich repeat (LRR) protein
MYTIRETLNKEDILDDDEIPENEKKSITQLDIIEGLVENNHFDSYYHIVHLRIEDNFLQCLNEIMENLTFLRSLNLSGNNLRYLPENFGNLKNLQILNLSHCRLDSLPENFGNLKNLFKLDLGGNVLAFLPDSIGNLKSLQTLYVYNNNLRSLPESIGNLKNLKDLRLSNNHLTFLPESIENLESLEQFFINNNPLKTIPNCFSNMEFVKYDIDHLTAKGIKLSQYSRDKKEFTAYYNKSPIQIALQYISEPTSLTNDEKERLVHEAGKIEINFLEMSLPPNDPILTKIIDKKSFDLSNGLKIFY